MELWKTMTAAFAAGMFGFGLTGEAGGAPNEPGGGVLSRVTPDGKVLECPLRHTAVNAELSGPLAQVVVRQDFVNESKDTIEATYLFPLPQMAAVIGYEMHVNDRIVKGKIARREEAQKAFEQARAQGKTAGLLNQQRPNVFQQNLTNIPPGGKVSVEIRFVDLVKYEGGTYEWAFPMVVGPRYFPQHAAHEAHHVNPPVAAKGLRAGHDISVNVKLSAGVSLAGVSSVNHAIQDTRLDALHHQIALSQGKEIPNKDFVLRWKLDAARITPSLLTHRSGNDGYFSFVIDPPATRPLPADIAPKELVFVIDTSGSMHGFPLDKAKEAMMLAIDGLHPRDTFNLITFAGDTHVLWSKPMPATPDNVAAAKQFLQFRQGGGGTEMMKAIRASLEGTNRQEHLRIVCFMTDGYVGNENEIIAEIRKHPNARVFSFGIGSSVNRFLLDKMAEAGRGEVEYVSLNSDGSAAAKRFHQRVRTPLLTDIELLWNGLPVQDVVPARIPDLFDAKPIIVSGRYSGAASGKITIRGKQGGRAYSRDLEVVLPAAQSANVMVPSIWARRKVDALSVDEIENRESITALGLKYGLMTKYTSYYAVEERVVNEGGKVRRVDVPVDIPEGVSIEGVYGGAPAGMMARSQHTLYSVAESRAVLAPPPAMPRTRDAEKRVYPAVQVRVKVMLKAASPEVLKKLKELGFVADAAPAGALFLTGEIAATKLEELREVVGVLRVEEI
jgi:Ca-activated chloride channel family protein